MTALDRQFVRLRFAVLAIPLGLLFWLHSASVPITILLAGLLVAAGYVTLTFYDYFALRTIGRRHVPYRIAALASSPAANTAPTSAGDPPRRERKIGSSGRKNQNPTEASRLQP